MQSRDFTARSALALSEADFDKDLPAGVERLWFETSGYVCVLVGDDKEPVMFEPIHAGQLLPVAARRILKERTAAGMRIIALFSQARSAGDPS